MTLLFESGPALIENAPPQQRPVLICPSCVNRKTGRRFSPARRRGARIPLAQPSSSGPLFFAVGSNPRPRFSPQAKSLGSGFGFGFGSADWPSIGATQAAATKTDRKSVV